MLTFFICYAAVLALIISAQWRIYEKAGEAGWKCLVPVYNIVIMLKIVGKPAWWTPLVIVLAPIFGVWMVNMLAKSFGKNEGFTVGLFPLCFIFWPVLGFGPAQYHGPYGDKVAYEAYRRTHGLGFDFERDELAR
jgi:Family of unknown function (DUF5684)